jgi:peptidoglycan pentaglycine glycine transferase (the first glycine)
MPEASLTVWKQFINRHPEAHLLQMGEWGELKSAFGWKAVRLIFNEATGMQILFRQLPLGWTIAYIPKPVNSGILLARGTDLWKEVDAVCRQHRAVFLKLEPDLWEGQVNQPANLGIEPSPYNIQPPRTIIVDIHSSEAEILGRMKQKTRYNIRLAEKKGVTVQTWNDIGAFHQMMLVTGGRDEFGVHALAYYRRAYDLFHPIGKCELLVAEYEQRPIAALMVFAHGRRAWYVYGASTDEERNRMPTYLLQWEAMRWARKRGCGEYDLWGVPDEDEGFLEANFEKRSDGLWGIYRFKRGFGGELKRASQAFDRVYHPMLHRVYLWRMADREAA